MSKYLCTYRYVVSKVIEAESKDEARDKINTIIDCNNIDDIATFESAECESITDEELAQLLEDE